MDLDQCKRTYYITTSIPYVNAAPHIGHALEFVQADVLARYHRLIGDNTRFLTGTDDNSLKNVLAAAHEGIPVRELVDRNSKSFLDLNRALGISNDDFIRTSVDARHIDGARRLWGACQESGDIYTRSYQGLYCVGCEQFYTPKELIDGHCPEHGTEPELVEEENYFFRLSRYADKLIGLIDSGRLKIIPATRANEVRAFIAQGLEDFSISRSQTRARGWGIQVPDDPSQVMYVWFDALTNYITALDYVAQTDLYQQYWIKNQQRVHAIGKGILRFHAIYWPAMLLSAGEPVPTTIFVHGYLTVAGQKISKSLGNVIDPFELVRYYGADPIRYWLLKGVPPTDDADFTYEKMGLLYTADLANDLGNLLNRTVSMLHRYKGGTVPTPSSAAALDQDLQELASGLAAQLHRTLGESYDPQAALGAIWKIVGRANRYIEETAPWSLAKAVRAGDVQAPQRLDCTLYCLAESLRIIAEGLRPFLPTTSEQIAQQLGVSLAATDWSQALIWGGLAAGTSVAEARPIFPKLEAWVVTRW
jgi:methionyl-tRNA synthetase